jgi:hypothetical protein
VGTASPLKLRFPCVCRTPTKRTFRESARILPKGLASSQIDIYRQIRLEMEGGQ